MTFEINQNIEYLHSTWAEFKKYIDGTYATLAFQFQEKTDFYFIRTEQYANMHQIYNIAKDSGADQIDFETNFKTLPPRTPGNFGLISVGGSATNGSSASSLKPILIGASDGTNLRNIISDSSGRLIAVGLGTAGTPSGGVFSVQGVSGGQSLPISGTVTSNQGTANTLANAWSVKITDVTNGPVAVKAASTAAIATDSAIVVAISPNNSVAVTQSTASSLRSQTASESATGSTTPSIAGLSGGTVTTAAPTYTTGNLGALSLTTSGLLRVDNSGVTQPISGTIAATQSDTWTVQPGNTANTTPWLTTINQGGNSATVSAGGALKVAATQSGTWTVQPGNTANTTPWLATINQGGNSATVSAAGALKVDNSAVTQPVSGTITANIGTSGSLALDATVAKLTIAQSTALGTNTQALMGASVTTAAPTYTTGNINPLSLTTSGLLRVDNSGVTQPVSGTVTANQGGTWNITNISGTVSLPTGAATESSLAKLTLAQGSATSGQTGHLIFGAVTTAAPTYTTGQSSPLSLDTTGALRITGTISASNPSVSTTAATPPASATYIGGSVTTAAPTYTTGQMNALSLTTAGALRVDSSTTTQPISGTVAATQSGTWTVQPGNTANTTPWLTTINQGGNSAVVKAASTAAATTDSALVVAVSPNNTVGVLTPDTTSSGTLNALNAVATITTAGQYGVGFQLAAGTLIGTIVPEVSFDGGTTWVSSQFDDPSTGNKSTSIVFAVANTATNRSIILGAGVSSARVRVSAFTSGTATCSIRASQTSDPSVLYTGANGSTAPPTTALVGGTDGTNIRTLKVSTDGTILVTSVDGTKATYSAAATFAAAATPTDVFTITGSATKTVRITRIIITGTQTTAAVREVLLVKRSTANTGGTSTAPNKVPYDSNSAAATATVLAYTANPTALGAIVGNILTEKVFIPTTASVVQSERILDFGTRNSQALVLRGTSQVIAVNLNSVTSAGNSFSMNVEWTEE